MKRSAKQYLDYCDWPTTDKTLWKAAFAPGAGPFDDGGPGARLSEHTIHQLRYAYGKFLYFLSVERGELLERGPAVRIDAKIVEEFVEWQPVSCGSVTLSIYLFHLWLALRNMYPRKR
jgi:hypothetical protein